MSKCNTSWLNYMIDLLTDNKWITVIRDTLMKALAITFSWIATVKVTDRFTQKHYNLQCDIDFVNRHHDVKRWSVMLFKQRKSQFNINDWLSWQILIELQRYISQKDSTWKICRSMKMWLKCLQCSLFAHVSEWNMISDKNANNIHCIISFILLAWI